jgi:hypothetical protein
MLNAIKHRLAFAFLYPKELLERVDLCTDVFTGLKAHHDKLAIFRRIQDRAEGLVLLRHLFDVVDGAFHSFLPPIWTCRNLIGEKVLWGSSEFHEQHAIRDGKGDL